MLEAKCSVTGVKLQYHAPRPVRDVVKLEKLFLPHLISSATSGTLVGSYDRKPDTPAEVAETVIN